MPKASLQGDDISDVDFERLKFSDIGRRTDDGGRQVLYVLFNHYMGEEASRKVFAPGFDAENLKVSIKFNDQSIVSAQLEEIVSELSGQMLEERKNRCRFGDFEAAVQLKAEQLVKDSTDRVEDRMGELANTISMFNDSLGGMVQKSWDEQHKLHISPEMLSAGVAAISGSLAPNTDPTAVITEVFTSMMKARKSGFAAKLDAPDLSGTQS